MSSEQNIQRTGDTVPTTEPCNWNTGFTYTQPYHPQGICPNCGHCPHCGRGGYPYPYFNPYQPYIQSSITCGSGTLGQAQSGGISGYATDSGISNSIS